MKSRPNASVDLRAFHNWNATAAEVAAGYPCDDFLAEPREAMWRAVDIGAPVPVIFRWLCQLRVAPYSYDLLDNLGRTSPRSLTPGLEQLAPGQTVMTIFELVAFETDSHLTLRLRDRLARALFGQLACTYQVTPGRLTVKLLVCYPRWSPMRWILPLGDLIMMRKQLLTLKRLAERGQ